MRLWQCFASLTALTLLVLTGCSSSVTVTGKLVQNGQAYALPPGESLEVHFLSADPQMYPPRDFMTMANQDGTFTADQGDPAKKGLPPGKYKLKLHSETPELKKKLSGQPELTTEIDTSKGSKINLTIDVGSRTVTQ